MHSRPERIVAQPAHECQRAGHSAAGFCRAEATRASRKRGLIGRLVAVGNDVVAVGIRSGAVKGFARSRLTAARAANGLTSYTIHEMMAAVLQLVRTFNGAFAIVSALVGGRRTRLWLSPDGICFVGSSLIY